MVYHISLSTIFESLTAQHACHYSGNILNLIVNSETSPKGRVFYIQEQIASTPTCRMNTEAVVCWAVNTWPHEDVICRKLGRSEHLHRCRRCLEFILNSVYLLRACCSVTQVQNPECKTFQVALKSQGIHPQHAQSWWVHWETSGSWRTGRLCYSMCCRQLSRVILG